MRVRKDGWKGRVDSFLLDLESGKFDPDLNEPELEPSKDSTVNNESATEANGAAVPSVPAEDAKTGDDDMQFNVDADEEPGDNEPIRADTNGKTSFDSKRNINRGEEISVAPEGNQVMIRTIPPDIGRVKLEEV